MYANEWEEAKSPRWYEGILIHCRKRDIDLGLTVNYLWPGCEDYRDIMNDGGILVLCITF